MGISFVIFFFYLKFFFVFKYLRVLTSVFVVSSSYFHYFPAESVMVTVKHHGPGAKKNMCLNSDSTLSGWINLGKSSGISEMQLSLIWTNLLHGLADWFIYSFIGTAESLWLPTVCRDLCYSLRIQGRICLQVAYMLKLD